MSNFIHEFWREHSATWNHDLVVRFPPEPNGFLHLGHAKAILVNADLADAFGGRLLLRMDDTNPRAERPEYEEAIVDDLAWLGIGHDPTIRYASDHFPLLRSLAEALILSGDAYVDTSSREDMARMRGAFGRPGIPSPDRDLPAEHHLERFRAMCDGKVSEGSMVLRARLDLASPNMVLRDTVLWRVMDCEHPRLPGWHALPTYDFAHPFCDVRDGVSLSLCSLEFEEHKPFYDTVVRWALEHGMGLHGRAPPVELEFARLEPDVGVTSKRLLRAGVESGEVTGWDDPRLLTLRGLRARGFSPATLKAFVRRLGVSRAASVAPLDWLEEEVRNEVGTGETGLLVVDPVALVLTGDGDDPVAKEVCDHAWFVGRADVREAADPNFFRLAPGNRVRLMGLGGFARVHRVDSLDGRITAVHAHFETGGKSKATVHVLAAARSAPVTVEKIKTWSGTGPAADCWEEWPALAGLEHMSKVGPFHAPRVGWGYWADAGRWRWLAPMKGA